MIEQDGNPTTVAGEDANFAEELAFERRVRHIADIAA
jgi:hypothetical protein